jgi:hypothetical protein
VREPDPATEASGVDAEGLETSVAGEPAGNGHTQ